jgi:DedD protein
METRVKERLIGAVILVALIVALVPEILSGPHKSTDEDSSAGSEQSVRTYTVDLEASGSPAEPPSTTVPPPVIISPEEPAATLEKSSEPSDLPEYVATIPPPAPETQAPNPSRTEPPASTTATTGWAVQLGSFSNAENAERLARELRRDGYKAFVSPYQSSGQKRLRVRVGPEQDRARADQLAKRLRRDGHPGTVVEHP